MHVQERLVNLVACVTESLHNTVSRGLFTRHKAVFSLLICAESLRHSGRLPDAEWSYLLHGGTAAATPSQPPEHVPRAAWLALAELEANVPVFKGLRASVQRDFRAWEAYSQLAAPWRSRPPAFGAACGALTDMHLLLLTRCWLPHKLVHAVQVRCLLRADLHADLERVNAKCCTPVDSCPQAHRPGGRVHVLDLFAWSIRKPRRS